MDTHDSSHKAKRARKTTESIQRIHSPHRFQQTWRHPSENLTVAVKAQTPTETHAKHVQYWNKRKYKNSKMIWNGSPRGFLSTLGWKLGQKNMANKMNIVKN